MKEFDLFLEIKSRDKSHYTISNYEYMVGKFLEYFKLVEAKQIDSLKASDYLNYQGFLIKEGLSNSSCNIHFKFISSFLNWLHAFEHIDKYPEIKKVRPLTVPTKAIFSLTEDEEKAIVQNCKNIEDQLLTLLLFSTGMRRGELVQIKVSDIQGDRLLIHRKENKEQKIKLTPEALFLIKAHLAQRKVKSNYLFCGASGKPISGETVRLRIKAVAKEANIPEERLKKITPHVARKTFACLLLDNDVSIKAVQQLLGHASVSTTEKYYATVSDKKLDQAILSQKPLL